MDDAVQMGVFQGICYLTYPADGLVPRRLPVAEPICKASTLNIFGDDEADVPLQTDIVDGNDVVVLEPGDASCLCLERLLGLESARLWHFDGDGSLKFGVVGTEHLGESAFRDQLVQSVTISESPRRMRRKRGRIGVRRVVVQWLVQPGDRLQNFDPAGELVGEIGMILGKFSGGRVLATLIQLLPFEEQLGQQFLIPIRHRVPRAVAVWLPAIGVSACVWIFLGSQMLPLESVLHRRAG